MKDKIWKYLIIFICFISGIYLIFSPVNSINKVISFIGIILIITGVIKLIQTITTNNQSKMIVTNGILNIILGIILKNNPNITINLLSSAIGLWLILSSTNEIMIFKNYKKINQGFVKSIVKIILGLIIIVIPNITAVFTGYIIGSILVVIAIYKVIELVNSKPKYKVRVK